MGALFVEPSKPLGENVVIDGQFVTGSNPSSAQPLAQAIIQRLTLAA